MYGECDLAVCFLSSTVGVDSSRLHHSQTTLDGVEKQTNVPKNGRLG